jgi:hypothetical protein
MQRKLILAIVLLLAASLAFASTVWAQEEEEPTLVRLEVRNRTNQIVSLVLTLTDPETEGDVFASAMAVPAGTTRTFTLPRGGYTHTTFACGDSQSGTLDLAHQTRLIFPTCFALDAKQGEPSMEKIHIEEEIPDGINFRYQAD